jgi:hypothetical protein
MNHAATLASLSFSRLGYAPRLDISSLQNVCGQSYTSASTQARSQPGYMRCVISPMPKTPP